MKIAIQNYNLLWMKLQGYNPFISIRELFGIFLPGAITCIGLMWLFQGEKDEVVDLLSIGDKPNTFLIGLAFLLVSYFIGHVIFQLGSFVDDWLYDPLKDVLYKQSRLQLLRERRAQLFSEEFQEKINNFDWSLNRLRQLEYKGFYDEVEAIVSDAKFFRAVFVLCILVHIGLEVYQFGEFSNVFFIITILITLYVFRRLYQLTENIEDLGKDKTAQKEELKSRKEDHYSFWKWSWFLCYALLILIHIGQNVEIESFQLNQLSHAFVPIFLGLLTPLSLYLYFQLRQKSCKKLYAHILFIDRKLKAINNTTIKQDTSDE